MEEPQSRLIEAAGRGDLPTVAALLAAGADPNGREDGETPLAAAARGNHADVATALLEAGADPWLSVARPDHSYPSREVPLVAAARQEHREVAVAIGRGIRAWRERHPEDDRFDQEYLQEALETAADGWVAWTAGLLAAGADPTGWPLILGIQSGSTEVVALMLAAGADPNDHILEDDTAEYYRGDDKEKQHPIPFRYHNDVTPLHRAVTAQWPEITELLLRAGADPNLPLADGMTPLKAARGRVAVRPDPSTRERIIALLKAYGARE